MDTEEGNLSYWQSFRQNYTEVQLGSTPFWLEAAQKNDVLQNLKLMLIHSMMLKEQHT